MSLNWQLSKIKDYETVCWINEGDQRKLSPLTECIIWGTFALDIGKITEKNVNEWMWRMAFLKQLNKGNLVYERHSDGVSKGRSFTREELVQHIGLLTNVTTMTRAQFVHKWIKILRRNCDALAQL